MRKHILIMLTAAVFAWTAAMVLHSWAYAADESIEDETKGQWQVYVHIESADGEHRRDLGWFGDLKKKEVYRFDTEAGCNKFLATNSNVKTVKTVMAPLAAKMNPPGHVVFECKVKPDML